MGFAERIRQIRKKNMLTQRGLADLFQVTSEEVVKWETSQELPSAETLIEISEYYKISVDCLLGLKDTEKEEEKQENREIGKLNKKISFLEKENVQQGRQIKLLEQNCNEYRVVIRDLQDKNKRLEKMLKAEKDRVKVAKKGFLRKGTE